MQQRSQRLRSLAPKLAVVSVVAALAGVLGAAPANAAAYDWSQCGGYLQCGTPHDITPSSADRLIMLIRSSQGFSGSWAVVRLSDNVVVASGTSSGTTYQHIVTSGLSTSKTYVLITSLSGGNVSATLCNFTTYAGGGKGPCMP